MGALETAASVEPPAGASVYSTATAGDEQKESSSRASAARGRSFAIGRMVSAARKSFDLSHRPDQSQQQDDADPAPPTMKRYFTQALWLDHQSGMHMAHAPPPGMVEPPLPPESEEDEHEYVEHVDVKAISLEGLRAFVKTHRITPIMTTHQVVRSVIIPATMGRHNTALVDTDALAPYALPGMDSEGAAAARKAAGPPPPYTRMPMARPVAGVRRRAPYYYVVHAWSRPFLEMVAMLEAHFAGRPAQHTYVWIDVFAIPQVSPDHSGFIQEIQRAIWYGTCTLACFDPAATLLGRLWCLYEMFYTLISKQCAHALVALTAVPLTAAQRTALYRRVDCRRARCSVKEDKKKLDEHVLGYTRRGPPAINNYIRSGLVLPPYDHPAVYIPHVTYEKRKGLLACFGGGAPPPLPPPVVPEHVAAVPAVAEPSMRKSAAPFGPGGEAYGGNASVGASHYGEERPLRLVMGACNVPHPLKTKKGGEDAFFLSAAGRGALGVADGVGSWSADDGVDPALYSRDLMRAAAASLEASQGRIGARMALADAHLAVKHAGSSTVMVGVLPPDSNTLQVINVGDSGLRLVRGGRLAMATRPQAHAHNMPYQLACPDEPVCDTDCTIQGDMYSIQLEAGDVLIMATDGMYDNVWPDEMLDIVNKALASALDSVEPPEVVAGSVGISVASPRTSAAAVAEAVEAPAGAAPQAGALEGPDGTVTVAASEEAGPTVAGALGSKLARRSTAVMTGAERARAEAADGIGKHAPVAGDDGEVIRADASSAAPPGLLSYRAAALARTLARTAAANMLRRDVRSPFAVELSKQPQATTEFRANPHGGKPDDVTVLVAVVVEADDAYLDRLVNGPVLDASSARLPTVSGLATSSFKLGAANGRR